jgi:hypothetical protein
MVSNMENALIQIIDSDNKVVGLGFVVSNGIAVTCAHNINYIGTEPNDNKVNIVFYMNDVVSEATVIPELWSSPDEDDIAVLRFKDFPPDVKPVLLGNADGSEGHTFSTMGFPGVANKMSVRARGAIYGIIKYENRKMIQVSSSEITYGFAGAPILDEATGRVIGMLVGYFSSEKFKNVSIAITSDKLLELLLPILPELELYAPKSILLPPGYEHYSRLLPNFLKDNPNPERNIFLMMRFKNGAQYQQIHKVLREKLALHGFNLIRADDKDYTGELWENVCLYILGCKYCIAVFEEIDEREFNPNVAFELGFAFALNKRCLILKDQRMPKMPTDIIGKLYKQFDTYNIKQSLLFALDSWLKDLGE